MTDHPRRLYLLDVANGHVRATGDLPDTGCCFTADDEHVYFISSDLELHKVRYQLIDNG